MNAERRQPRCWLLVTLCVLVGGRLFAQGRAAATVIEPRWFQLQLDEVSALLEIESQLEDRETAGATTERDYLYVEPALELKLHGSVYHPNLVAFELQPRLGPSWQMAVLDPPGGVHDSLELLQAYHASLDLLREKPFATRFYADKELTYRDFDFYTRARVDMNRFGGSTGYATGPVPVFLNALHLEEDITGSGVQATRLTENIFSADARNERGQTGQTELQYVFDQYRRRDEGVPETSGIEQTGNLFDTERLGTADWIQLYTAALYHRLSDTTLPSEGLTLQENVNLEHDPHLSSNYHYSYDLHHSGSVDSDSHEGSAVVHHQLYESLNSSFEVRGSSLSSRSQGSTFDTRRFGGAWTESYTKRLGEWGRLNLGDVLQVDHEDRQTTGQTIAISGESHVLTTGGPITFLNQPNIYIATVRVTDASGTITYTRNVDYLLIDRGAQTEIQRPAGSAIPNGSTVLLDYLANAQPDGSFVALNNLFSFRLDFYNGLLGVYSHLGYTHNFGGEGLVLEDVTSYIVGVDSTWHGLHAGAEYENYDSSLTPYRSLRLFEDLEYPLDDRVLLSANCSQNWRTFPDSNEEQTSYDFIGRCRARVTPALTAMAEGGMRIVRGNGIDQDLATVRATLDFVYGQMQVNLIYEFQDEVFLGELRDTHHIYLRVKRTF
jgi:hypothetical protein